MPIRVKALPPWGERLFARLSNLYFLLTLLIVLWSIFFDANSLMNILAGRRRISDLKEKREYYQQQIKEERRRLKELKTDRRNLEKFAREQYFMRKANEDIYVVVEE